MASWFFILLFVLFVGLCSFKFFFNKRAFKLPPGPLGFPVIGNLHRLGDLPHRDLQRLSNKYGPIMYLKLGQVPTIVVSTSEAAKLFFKTHDAVFASRPKTQFGKYISYGNKGVAPAQYGPYWRNMRRLCTTELLTNAKIEMFNDVRREELISLVEELKVAANAGAVVGVSEKVELLVEGMVYRMFFGKKDYQLMDCKVNLREGFWLAGSFNLIDFLPFLAPFDLQGLTHRNKSFSRDLDKLLMTIIDEHEKHPRDGNQMDIIDIMLSLMDSNNAKDVQFDLEDIKAIVIDLILAGIDTSATTISWVISEVMKHPSVMKQVQEELNNIVGRDRMVEETDLPKLKYLYMVIKETMRLHPPGPLLLPHESIEDVVVNDFYIPKGSRLIVNAWAIGRDPNVWSDNVEEFDPSRFAIMDVDLKGQHFELVPFGVGRRVCPGMQMGLRVVQLVMAQLLHCFNWELPHGMSPNDLDMSERIGLIAARAKHLLLVPSNRLIV